MIQQKLTMSKFGEKCTLIISAIEIVIRLRILNNLDICRNANTVIAVAIQDFDITYNFDHKPDNESFALVIFSEKKFFFSS